MKPRRVSPWRCAVNSALSASDNSGTAPRPSRSSGTKARPSARRLAASRRATGSPLSMIVSARESVRSPERAAINSFWPLPETPAMPTISPPRTLRSISTRSVPKGSSAGSERLRTISAPSPRVRASRCCGCGRSPPIIMRASPDEVSCRGSQVPVTRPERSTVAFWHSARISSSLWLMYRIEQPSDDSRRSVSNSFCTACGVSTDVGSSMISNCGCCSRQRTISTRCRSPTDIECTWRCGSSGRP